MSRLVLSRKYDLYISMTWSQGNHGVSGHIFEIIDYYLILKNHFNVGILICEDMNWDIFVRCIETKYNLTIEEIQEIKQNTTFHLRPKYIHGKNILFVDGNLKRAFVSNGVILCFRRIFSFRCSKKDTFYDLPYSNITLLQDNRVYNDNDVNISTHYVKKLLLSRYKNIENKKTNTALLYLTSNCRRLSPDYIIKLIRNNNFERYILATNEPDFYTKSLKMFNISYPNLPIDDIFELFDTYVYTPIMNPNCGCFDCSPRFIVECKFYGKDVVYYDIDEKYLDVDTGLRTRINDINTCLDLISLDKNDKIVDILKSKIYD